ncbi:uncharacterized protein LOC105392623 [Plutella xylostella]|uniref:uncharacterized protein LOC105392623 n=1 Tax=Plutella xylostella TaxID=51655 RepID=UPI00203274DD|nr:uncharacterized protein LOC105392623 [Plutella xylostella]XP_037966656.2 uncharacterized protein LOC105392623 [Plutella xylostella]
MFCVQESDSGLNDTFSNDKDPLDSASQQSDSDDEHEPTAKRPKMAFNSGINLQVYKIPAFNIPKSLSIFPSPPTSTLPMFVNNPLNLANPLTITANGNGNYNPLKRYSLPAKLPMTPFKGGRTSPQKAVFDSGGGIVRYKKNGEVAKKRGPPKGYKRKPKQEGAMINVSGMAPLATLTPAQNMILTGLLASANAPPATNGATQEQVTPKRPPQLTIVPQIKVPPGVELVEMELDPADWFPEEPYKMSFSRKKNPKWKSFPFRCEHCFKGYRVVSTLLQHAAERHGAVPRALAIPCPCCPHVSTRRNRHKRHLETHAGKRHRIFCQYCLPPPDPNEPYVKESEKYPFDKFPQYWYASEESLRLHKKRKHPYAAMFNYNWQCTWGDLAPNS